MSMSTMVRSSLESVRDDEVRIVDAVAKARSSIAIAAADMGMIEETGRVLRTGRATGPRSTKGVVRTMPSMEGSPLSPFLFQVGLATCVGREETRMTGEGSSDSSNPSISSSLGGEDQRRRDFGTTRMGERARARHFLVVVVVRMVLLRVEGSVTVVSEPAEIIVVVADGAGETSLSKLSLEVQGRMFGKCIAKKVLRLLALKEVD